MRNRRRRSDVQAGWASHGPGHHDTSRTAEAGGGLLYALQWHQLFRVHDAGCGYRVSPWRIQGKLHLLRRRGHVHARRSSSTQYHRSPMMMTSAMWLPAGRLFILGEPLASISRARARTCFAERPGFPQFPGCCTRSSKIRRLGCTMAGGSADYRPENAISKVEHHDVVRKPVDPHSLGIVERRWQ